MTLEGSAFVKVEIGREDAEQELDELEEAVEKAKSERRTLREEDEETERESRRQDVRRPTFFERFAQFGGAVRGVEAVFQGVRGGLEFAEFIAPVVRTIFEETLALALPDEIAKQIGDKLKPIENRIRGINIQLPAILEAKGSTVQLQRAKALLGAEIELQDVKREFETFREINLAQDKFSRDIRAQVNEEVTRTVTKSALHAIGIRNGN